MPYIFPARNHPELCEYLPPGEDARQTKRRGAVTSRSNGLSAIANHSDEFVTVPRAEWERLCALLPDNDTSLADIRAAVENSRDLHALDGHQSASPGGYSSGSGGPLTGVFESEVRQISNQGLHTRNDITGQEVHLGASSVPALVIQLRRERDQPNFEEIIGKKNLLPLFGLDNESATYPFVDLWGLPHGSRERAIELAALIPNDTDCINFFQSYRDNAHVVYPALPSVERFETELMEFVLSRAHAGQSPSGVTEEQIYGRSFHWIGVLFATLALGSQCINAPRKQNQLTAQVFICCAFECLRFTNFLSQPNLQTIQTLLILGYVISNNMNAGVSWALLGLTIRLAQSLGLHRSNFEYPSEEKTMRSRVWWMLIWQDCHLSLSYDRASAETVMEYPLPEAPDSTPGTRSFIECMYRLVRIGLEIVRERATVQDTGDVLVRISRHRIEIQNIMTDATEHLRDSRRCHTHKEKLEHWALYLHVSYITSELCRPGVSPHIVGASFFQDLRSVCVESLCNTVEAFLGLTNITLYTSRAWTALHRGLSSALLLGLLGETSKMDGRASNERARRLVESLVLMLTEMTSAYDVSDPPGPLTRSIKALQIFLDSTVDDRAGGPYPKLSNLPSACVPVSMVHNMEDTNPKSGLTASNGDSLIPSEYWPSGNPTEMPTMEKSPHSLMSMILWGNKN